MMAAFSICHTARVPGRRRSERAASCICITWCRGRESNPLNILTSSNRETPTYKRSVPPCPEVKGRAGRLAIGKRDQWRRNSLQTRPTTIPARAIPTGMLRTGSPVIVVSIVLAILVTVVTIVGASAAPAASAPAKTIGTITTDLLSNHSPKRLYLKCPRR